MMETKALVVAYINHPIIFFPVISVDIAGRIDLSTMIVLYLLISLISESGTVKLIYPSSVDLILGGELRMKLS